MCISTKPNYQVIFEIFFCSSLFSVDMIFLAELYVKDFISIPPDTIHFAAPDGRPGGDSVTNQCSPEELRSYQPIQNSEEAIFYTGSPERKDCIS
jgi:hypothetical protein